MTLQQECHRVRRIYPRDAEYQKSNEPDIPTNLNYAPWD
eukprot:CAMPEP_0194157908 /NCGR_PEP_ID=MMETSP0152-20130528/73846_1 /TAXON_ID=1049557 /ORGANISM="Thalassiothrix antarctica, Strain L6-D1" /LENGTH=38 /DNA_ID= /DNA_START= /DNA_END= /DNA_ORIENTATION=